MKESTTEKTNIFETIKNSIDNTLNFENCSYFKEYDYEDRKYGSVLGLCYEENYVINNMIPYLKIDSDIKAFTEEEQNLYAGKPMKLSYDIYNTTDYWWILLAVNGYMNPQAFHSFTQLIIPSLNSIENILDKESFTNKKLGVIPESTNR